MKFCTKCGSKLNSTKFCINCGAEVEEGQVPPKSSSSPKQWSATVGPNGLTQCPQCGKTLRVHWTGKPGNFVCPIGAGGCGINFSVTVDPKWSKYTTGGGQNSAQTQSSQQSQPSPPLTTFILACPKCQRAIGLPQSTYGISQCICGFNFRFRTQEKVGVIVPQVQWLYVPQQDPCPEYQVSLESTTIHSDGSVSLDCPACGTNTTVVSPGYSKAATSAARCSQCQQRFLFALAQSPNGVMNRARPFENGIPMRPFKPLPLISERIIYCSECLNQLGPGRIPPDSTFNNPGAPAAYDRRVLPTVGEVWTKCRQCVDAETEAKRIKEIKAIPGLAWGAVKLGVGCIWWGICIIGLLIFLLVTPLMPLALIALVILGILALVKFLFKD